VFLISSVSPDGQDNGGPLFKCAVHISAASEESAGTTNLLLLAGIVIVVIALSTCGFKWCAGTGQTLPAYASVKAEVEDSEMSSRGSAPSSRHQGPTGLKWKDRGTASSSDVIVSSGVGSSPVGFSSAIVKRGPNRREDNDDEFASANLPASCVQVNS
jgi:hypothetical protein